MPETGIFDLADDQLGAALEPGRQPLSGTGPLEGLRVLDLTRLQPGNYATLLLGDLGADVIKVEEPGQGDPIRWVPPMVGTSSAAHMLLNRNKRSVTLNLKRSEGVDLLLRLVKGADVLLESFRPGVMDRLGAGYGRLAGANPRLIYVAITGYGQEGPYRERPGHDINYIGIGGVLGKTGVAGCPPVLPGVQVADLAGAMMAVVGLLAALWRRDKTGQGELVDVSMLDAAISWLAMHVAPWFMGEEEITRGRGFLNGEYACYRVYECSDGKFISVGALEPKFWATLCAAIGHEELIPQQWALGERRREVHRVIEQTFRSRPRQYWVDALARLEACVTPVNDFAETFSDPQVLARGMLVTRGSREGRTWRELGLALHLRANPGSLRLPAPALGEHNEEVYGSLGLIPEEITRLGATGVI
jgi:Predicted acyl-CoA transferases/carnitine dehydratase